MYLLKESSGVAVAADTRLTLAALDETMVRETQLLTTALEAALRCDVPARATQDVIEIMAKGLNEVISARSSLVSAIAKLQAIQGRSNLAEHDFGCPAGLEARDRSVRPGNAGKLIA